MKVLVLGSGLMGRGAAYDLVNQDSVEQVIVADIDSGCAETLAQEMGSKAVAETVDATKKAQLVKVFSKVVLLLFHLFQNIQVQLNVLHPYLPVWDLKP